MGSPDPILRSGGVGGPGGGQDGYAQNHREQLPHVGVPDAGNRLGARSAGRDTIWPVATPADAFDRLPKVELHCHVEGTMRPATVVELARRNGVALPTADPTLLYRYDSLDSFLAVFWLVQSTLATRDDWARLAYESVVDGAAHGVVHRESFFTPARHLAGGQDLAAIVGGLTRGSPPPRPKPASRVS